MFSSPIRSALISVYYKDGLDELIFALNKQNITIYSTGGTLTYIQNLGIAVESVEDLTGFPEILGGRVKTLHPHVFGGILYQRDLENDEKTILEYNIPPIDLVVVDLYPFEETLRNTTEESEIIEKIDIGGVSLLRAAAKNYKNVAVLSSKDQYRIVASQIDSQNGSLTLDQRKKLAQEAFLVTSNYDAAIQAYFNGDTFGPFKIDTKNQASLRYGENPHQKAVFYGDLDGFFTKLNGKELSYNNLLDVDAAVGIMQEFEEATGTFAILKHNNACGIASDESIEIAYDKAFNTDPVSAFGGVLISNKPITLGLAQRMESLFFEVLIAPEFEMDALLLLKEKKNRILLKQNVFSFPALNIRSVLNGVLVQERDCKMATVSDLTITTNIGPSNIEIEDLLFANKIVKHTKSNCIVLAKGLQLLASGTGQTSRVDALKQAIQKAKSFGFDLNGAVMASDAFFPFPDCVEIAHKEGIQTVIQPGGSIKDEQSIEYCNNNNMKMVFTGLRHFKH